MNIVKLFALTLLCGQVNNIYSYSYGIDNYYNKHRYVKLHFRTCTDSHVMFVPANTREIRLPADKENVFCCLTAIELFDEGQRSIDYLRFGRGNGVSVFENNEILGSHATADIDDIICGNRNFVIDKHGRLGMWDNCFKGWSCVQISQATKAAVGSKAPPAPR